jgi:hypothetical protein
VLDVPSKGGLNMPRRFVGKDNLVHVLQSTGQSAEAPCCNGSPSTCPCILRREDNDMRRLRESVTGSIDSARGRAINCLSCLLSREYLEGEEDDP